MIYDFINAMPLRRHRYSYIRRPEDLGYAFLSFVAVGIAYKLCGDDMEPETRKGICSAAGLITFIVLEAISYMNK